MTFRFMDFLNYSKYINFFIILISSWIIAKTVNVAIGAKFIQVEQPKLSRASANKSEFSTSYQDKETYLDITERNIFDSANAARNIVRAVQEVSGPIVKSSLNATLIGTMVLSDPTLSIAVINYKGETRTYYVNDPIEDGTIATILRTRVEILRGEHREYLAMEEDAIVSTTEEGEEGEEVASVTKKPEGEGIYKKSETEFEIAREKLDSSLADLNSILKQARAIPYIVGGETKGFKIVAIRPNSIYWHLGIRNGDVIERVNGRNLDNVESVLTLFQSLRAESHFTIDLKRRGQKVSHSYDVK